MIKDLGIIIAAAGSSSRFGDDKLMRELDGMPLFLHSVRSFYPLCPPGNMILVVRPGREAVFKQAVERFLPDCKLCFVEGAAVRADSVRNGLAALKPETGFVAIHDAARPWATAELLLECLEAARKHGGAVPAKPVVDTLKRSNPDGRITATVCRDNLWQVETPQVFNLEKLREANWRAREHKIEFTDDASIMEAAGYDVHIVSNPGKNTKVTFSKDIKGQA